MYEVKVEYISIYGAAGIVCGSTVSWFFLRYITDQTEDLYKIIG